MKNLDYSILLKIQKPGRYFDNEINASVKKFQKAKFNIALCYPDAYEIGMSNTGIILLYRLLNSLDWVNCERVFSPFPDFEEILFKKNIKLFSLETKHPIVEFDALGFSYQYETAATNMLNVLKLSGIPLKSKDRKNTDPVIICGGPCTVNPLPISEFIDVFVIGDGENVVLKIAEIFLDNKNRNDRISAISKLESVYCPAVHNIEKNNIKRAVVYDYSKYLKYYEPFITNMDIIQNRVNIEIMRGCVRGCRFCLAGYINRPVRTVDSDEIMNTACGIISKKGI
ncbi:B12-binding domain-containing radical SAM protein, partial [Candidatus Dependentiae bacterium]|nr:B12-binding domain-containing radical SAM protein [Candidatus Dependentiae bacterium]